MLSHWGRSRFPSTCALLVPDEEQEQGRFQAGVCSAVAWALRSLSPRKPPTGLIPAGHVSVSQRRALLNSTLPCSPGNCFVAVQGKAGTFAGINASDRHHDNSDG